jgi:hypothetical protein
VARRPLCGPRGAPRVHSVAAEGGDAAGREPTFAGGVAGLSRNASTSRGARVHARSACGVTNISPSSRRSTSAAPDGGDQIGGGLLEGGERPVEAGEIEPSDQRRRLGQVAKPMTTSTTLWCADGGKAHWMYCLPILPADVDEVPTVDGVDGAELTAATVAPQTPFFVKVDRTPQRWHSAVSRLPEGPLRGDWGLRRLRGSR